MIKRIREDRKLMAGVAGGVLAVLAAVALVARMTVFASGAGADTTVLSVIAGEVLVQEAGTVEPRGAVDGEVLEEGDTVITRADGRAVITYFEGSTQSLEPGTEVTLESLGRGTGGGLLAGVTQSVGRTWNNVLQQSETGSDYRVTSSAATGAVRDTMFRYSVHTSGLTEAWSRQGTVAVEAQGEEQLATPGTSIIVGPGTEPGTASQVPASLSELQIRAFGQQWMLVRDPAGFSSGLVPPGAPVNQIPLTVINRPQSRPQLVSTLEATGGLYKLYMSTPEDAEYQITVIGASGGIEVCEVSIAGTVVPGQILRADLQINVVDGVLQACALSDAVVTDEDPYGLIVVPDDLEDAVEDGEELIPDIDVLGARTAEPTATATGSATAAAPTATRRAGVTGPEPTEPPFIAGPTAPPTMAPPPPTAPPGATPVPTNSFTPVPGSTDTHTPVPTPTHTPVPTATPIDTGTIRGQVTNALNGNPISGATVQVIGQGLMDVTDGSGNYEIAGVTPGNRTLRTIASGFIERTDFVTVDVGDNVKAISLSPVSDADEIRIVLTWGADPADLDAHLAGPRCGSTGRFHVAWFSQNPVPHAGLDVDDQSEFGPETITIRSDAGVWANGEYTFWVHNFGGIPEFGQSEAVVTVSRGDEQLAQFNVNAQSGAGSTTLDIWRVMTLNIDSAGNLSINQNLAGFYNDPFGTDTTLAPESAPAPASC